MTDYKCLHFITSVEQHPLVFIPWPLEQQEGKATDGSGRNACEPKRDVKKYLAMAKKRLADQEILEESRNFLPGSVNYHHRLVHPV